MYSGRTGTLLWMQTGAEGENLGIGLEGAGDINRDGAGDVVAGAPGSSRAYVYSGRDGRLLLTLMPDSTNEGFGASASGAGDQNGDGFDDVIVGAAAAGQGAGRAYLFSGKDGSRLRTLDGEHAGDGFGSIVAGAPRRRGTPMLVGAPGAGPGNHGRVYIFEGAAPRPRFVIESDSTGAALGGMFTSVVYLYSGKKREADPRDHRQGSRRDPGIRRNRRRRRGRRRCPGPAAHVNLEQHQRVPVGPDVHHLGEVTRPT